MKPPLDPRSALLGLVLGMAAMFALGAATAGPSGIGRYQIKGIANHGMLVDTVTGQVWTAHFDPLNRRTDRDFFQPKLEGPK